MVGLKQMTGAMKQIQPIAEESAKKAQWDPKKIPNYKKQLKLYRANNPADAETLPDRIRQQFPGEIKPEESQFPARSSGSLPKACRQPQNSTGAQPEYLQKNTNIANYCLLFSLFNCDFNQNIYYRAQITLTLKNFHKQIIYTYKRFKKTYLHDQMFIFAYYFHFSTTHKNGTSFFRFASVAIIGYFPALSNTLPPTHFLKKSSFFQKTA